MTNNVWPPEYSQFEDYTDAEFYKALEEETKNKEAPSSYRKVLSKVLTDKKGLEDKIERARLDIENITTKNTEYCEYVKAAEKNYEFLSNLYKREHLINLKDKEKILELQLELKTMREMQHLKEQRFKLQAEQMETSHVEKFERQKEEFTRAANKQAMGRKNIEDKLILKENELMDIKKKLSDMESRLILLESQRVEKVKETDHFKNENAQLKLLLAYLQPQQPTQTNQQPAQHIQHFQ